MPKAEKGTPKYLANKMKSKGLQKLRWYCQMCSKQCRDQNGFKCHIQSESHQRQLLIFAENPGRFLHDFSKEFEHGFMMTLKHCHGTKRVKANKVYQEYIADKEHVHMNATRWTTLTGFCMYLGKTGKCVVDETDEGIFIAWIDRDPETIARQEAKAKRGKLHRDDEERLAEFINKQVERANETKAQPEYSELVRNEPDEKVQVDLSLKQKTTDKTTKLASSSVFKAPKSSSSSSTWKKEESKKKSALEEIIEEEERRKKRQKREEDAKVKDYWLKRNIVVKVVTKALGDKYYRQKGYIREVEDRYSAIVVLLESGAKLKVDQEHLETVIPAKGKRVLIVNGAFRGAVASLLSIDIDNFKAVVKLEDSGESVSLPYEHFSKLYTAK